MRKIAIVGMAPSTHDQAPFNDESWELWGMAWDPEWHRYAKLFEMHDLEIIETSPYAKKDYKERLKELDNVYMTNPYYENLVYPLDEVIKVAGDYFNSSIGYMLALAITEGADKIGLWGVDMKADEEYAYQRPNTEYLIGLARGKGIDVYIPDESPLVKFSNFLEPNGVMTNYAGRYGKWQ